MKSDIQSSEGLLQMKWGSNKQFDNPSKFWNRDKFPSRWSTKNVPNTLSNFELKKILCSFLKSGFQSSEKLFNWNEGLRSSVSLLVGSEAEIFFNLGGLRKNYLTSKILISKIKILLCSFMKSDIQSSEGLFQMKWGSTKWNRAKFPSRWSTKKVLNTLSIFELKKYSCAVSRKAIFSLVKDIFNWVEGLRGTIIIFVGSETKINFHLGGQRKNLLTRQILSSKIKILLCIFMKSDIQSSEGLFQKKWGSNKQFDNPSKFWNRANFPSRWFTKDVLNKLSNSELKKYSCAVSWKAIFSLVKNFFNWVEGQRGTVKIFVGSQTELIFHIGDLRKST